MENKRARYLPVKEICFEFVCDGYTIMLVGLADNQLHLKIH